VCDAEGVVLQLLLGASLLQSGLYVRGIYFLTFASEGDKETFDV